MSSSGKAGPPRDGVFQPLTIEEFQRQITEHPELAPDLTRRLVLTIIGEVEQQAANGELDATLPRREISP